MLRLVLPSAADVLAAQAETSEERRSELEEMRRRSRELDADLDRLTRELMKNPLPDWARQQEMEAAIERQKTLQEELARVAAGTSAGTGPAGREPADFRGPAEQGRRGFANCCPSRAANS